MAFKILLQRNLSEPQKLRKDLQDVFTLDGELKDKSSLVDPTITFNVDMDRINACNYLTIPAFNRSYFIRDMVSIRNGLVEVTAHVDVLSSWIDELLANFAIVKKQEKKYNLLLNDGTFKVYQDPVVTTQPFPSGLSNDHIILLTSGG